MFLLALVMPLTMEEQPVLLVVPQYLVRVPEGMLLSCMFPKASVVRRFSVFFETFLKKTSFLLTRETVPALPRARRARVGLLFDMTPSNLAAGGGSTQMVLVLVVLVVAAAAAVSLACSRFHCIA